MSGGHIRDFSLLPWAAVLLEGGVIVALLIVLLLAWSWLTRIVFGLALWLVGLLSRIWP